MAGTDGDFETAKVFLALLQRELGISPPSEMPIFPAGSSQSRHATLSIPRTHSPQAWIDIYYPMMNTPLERALQALDDDGEVVWEAALEEVADDTDPEAGKYFDAVPTFHGLSREGDVTGKVGSPSSATNEPPWLTLDPVDIRELWYEGGEWKRFLFVFSDAGN